MKWLNLQLCGKKNIVYNTTSETYIPKDLKTTIDITNNKLFIYNNEIGNNTDDILNAIKIAVKEKQVKMVILDNLMSMNLSTYGNDKYDIQTKFVTDLSNLAKKLEIHIHFVCHPRKSTSFLRKNDISGTADLTNLADNVFIVHRVNTDFKNQIRELYHLKKDSQLYKEFCTYSNMIEICKNREHGVQDILIGQFFEEETKRFKNSKDEQKTYFEDGKKLINICNSLF